MKYKPSKIILFTIFLFSIASLFFLTKLNFKEVLNIFFEIKFYDLVVLFLIYGVVYIARTYRFYLYFKEQFTFYFLFIVMCLYNFFNNFIPAKLGELSIFPLLHKENVSKIRVLNSVLTFRIYDALIVILLFLIGLNFIDKEFFIYQKYFLFAILIIFILIIIFRKQIINKIINIKFISKYKTEFELFFKFNFKLILSSIIIFAMSLLFNWYLLYSLGYHFSLIQIIIAVTIPLFISILPIPTTAGVGSVHAGWVISLTLLNISLDNAIYLSIVLHAAQILMVLIYSLLGFILRFSLKEN